MASATFSKVFPCAKAPFDGDGKFRLWTEENITKVLRLVFDIDDQDNKAFISNDQKTLIIHGYIFENTSAFSGSSYYILVKDDTQELFWDSNNPGSSPSWTASLYTDAQTKSGYTCYGGTVTPIKCKQSQLPDLDLGNA